MFFDELSIRSWCRADGSGFWVLVFMLKDLNSQKRSFRTLSLLTNLELKLN